MALIVSGQAAEKWTQNQDNSNRLICVDIITYLLPEEK